MRRCAALAIAILLGVCALPASAVTTQVLVVGGGAGGVAAALQSARLGADTLLAEETGWLGGMYTAAGVSVFDGNPIYGHGTVLETGIFHEICQALRTYYQEAGRPITGARISFEPSVADMLLKAKCAAEPHLVVCHGWRPLAAVKDGSRVLGVRFATPQGEQVVSAQVTIDCTETGDLLALAGVENQVGRESFAQAGERYALGGPSNLETGYDPQAPADLLAQAPTAVLILERRPGDNPPVPEPPGYDPALYYDFDNPLVRVQPDGSVVTKDLASFLNYCRLGDPPQELDPYRPETWTDKFFINWPIYGNDCSGVNYYLADEAGRAQIVTLARHRSLGFVRYLQLHLQQMLGYNPLALSPELGPDGMPPVLYHRESRRLVGVQTMTLSDVERWLIHCLHLPPNATDYERSQEYPLRGMHHSDGIALGDYAVDIHACREWTAPYSPDGALFDQAAVAAGGLGCSTVPFQVPYAALVPAQTDGLLVGEKNISATHLASGATRLQPVVTLTGQAAGAAAALSALAGVRPRDLPTSQLQEALLAAGDTLYYWSDINTAYWAYPEIQKLSLAGVTAARWPDPIFYRKSVISARDMVTDHSFRPELLLLRWQLAPFLARCLHQRPWNNPTPTYTDVSPSDWEYGYVEALARLGVWQDLARAGWLFSPDRVLIRREMAHLLCNALHLPPLSPTRATFIDVPRNDPDFEWIEAVAAAGFTRKCITGSYFMPNRQLTRSEGMVWLYNAFSPLVPLNQPPELVYADLSYGGYLLVCPPGGSAAVRVIGQDPEGRPLAYSATGLPPGATYDQEGWLRWQPPAGSPTPTHYAVALQVSDGELSDTCELDLACLARPSLAINAGAPATSSPQVTLDLAAQEVVTVTISNGAGSFTDPCPYAPQIAWTLAAQDGLKTVTVRGDDAQGRGLWELQDSILLDQVAPQVTISAPAPGAVLRGTFPVSAQVMGEEGPVTVTCVCAGRTLPVLSAPPYTWSVDSVARRLADGAQAIRVTAQDQAGNQTSAAIAVTLDNATFADVPLWDDRWPYVEAVYREGITAGCQRVPPLYCPEAAITRAQLAVFLCRAMGEPPCYPGAPTFADLPPTHSAYPYVEALARLGVVAGCRIEQGQRYFCPAQPATRSQMAVMLCRAAGLPGYANPVPTFADVPPTAGCYPYVEAVFREGITTGCGWSGSRRLYCPDQAVTRGQMAVFVVRAFHLPL